MRPLPIFSAKEERFLIQRSIECSYGALTDVFNAKFRRSLTRGQITHFLSARGLRPGNKLKPMRRLNKTMFKPG